MKHGSVWVLALALGAGLVLGACAPVDECEEAVDKLVGECGFGSGAAIDDSNGECKDRTKCLAKCVVKYDCERIIDEDANSYDECVADCHSETY